jgi:hypothetical protein
MLTLFFPLNEFVTVADKILNFGVEDQIQLCAYVVSMNEEIYFGIMFDNDTEEEQHNVDDVLFELDCEHIPHYSSQEVQNLPRFY